MSDWTSGYVADVGYIYGYYESLNPLWARFALTAAGLACPEIGTACELGFGQGLSINMHAAASPTRWYGNDFAPAQAAFARDLAVASGSGAVLTDESFEEFCSRADLPDFDFIGLHGIWSWISEQNRSVIADFLRRRLKPGGLVYISYNCLPGWAPIAPLRHLLQMHVRKLATGDSLAARLDAALTFVTRLLETDPLYAKGNPAIADNLGTFRKKDRNYLAHEFLNEDWLPSHFSEIGDRLGPAKLSYACSAHLPDHVEALNLQPAEQALLAETADAVFRETLRDFLTATSFRRDYWTRGARRLSGPERADALRKIPLVLKAPRSDLVLMVQGALGRAELHEATYGPILDIFADHEIHPIGEIAALLGPRQSFAELLQALTVLVGIGGLAVAQDPAAAAQAKGCADRLNARLLRKARGDWEVTHLASPVTGGAVTVDRIDQLFLLARAEGLPPEQWPRFVRDLLAMQGQAIRRDGKALDAAQMLSALEQDCRAFRERRLPVLTALMVA